MRVTTMLAAAAATAAGVHAQTPVPLKAMPFSLSEVELTPGSRFDIATRRNFDYLFNLNSSRLLCLYTSAANMTGTFDNPTCQPYDHPQCEGGEGDWDRDGDGDEGRRRGRARWGWGAGRNRARRRATNYSPSDDW
jgi:hypothetical protein